MNKNLLIAINNLKLSYKYKKLIALVPNNKLSLQLIQLLSREGYIKEYNILNNKHILIKLPHVTDKYLWPLLSNIKIISKPSRPISIKHRYLDYFHTKNNLNLTLLLNSSGLILAENALINHKGGELLFIIK